MSLNFHVSNFKLIKLEVPDCVHVSNLKHRFVQKKWKLEVICHVDKLRWYACTERTAHMKHASALPSCFYFKKLLFSHGLNACKICKQQVTWLMRYRKTLFTHRRWRSIKLVLFYEMMGYSWCKCLQNPKAIAYVANEIQTEGKCISVDFDRYFTVTGHVVNEI